MAGLDLRPLSRIDLLIKPSIGRRCSSAARSLLADADVGDTMTLKCNLRNTAALLAPMLLLPAVAMAQTPPAPTTEQTVPDAAEPVQRETITVLGRFIPEPMQDTSEVATFLTAEDLERTGDDNAAAALTRLAGLSVVSGRFVYVRGLGDRYSSALLNGSPLPSPEPLRRQVPLDLFPSNILAGAEVQKTFSPNFPGEFGGGVINLETLKIPDESFLQLKASTGWNSESTNRRGYTYRGNAADWTGIGFDDALRDIPAPIAQGIALNRRIDDTNFTPVQLERMGESLVNSPFTVIFSEKLQPDFKGEMSGGTKLRFDSFDLGLVGALGYDNSWRTKRADRTEYTGSNLEQSVEAETTVGDVVFNGFGGATLDFGDNEISATGLLIRSTSKYAQVSEGFNVSLPGSDPLNPVDNQRVEKTAWYERQLATFQLEGTHKIGRWDFDWRTEAAESTRDAPYERAAFYDIVNGQAVFGGGGGQSNYTRFTDLKDQVASAGFDASYHLPIWGGREAVLSAGGVYTNTTRNYSLYQFSFSPARGPTPIDVYQARIDYIFSPDNIDPNRFVLGETTGKDDSYKGRLTNTAFYVASDIELIPLVRVALGARYESATELVRTYNRFGETPTPAVTLDNDYVLPAATLTWNFAEDLQLRTGFSQTIARPQFRELAFTPFIDPDNDRVYQGNPFLQDTEFDNFDARVEYYFGKGQFVTVGGFYKKVTNPIEEVTVKADRFTTRYINAPEATLSGAEIEFRTNFAMPFTVPGLDDADWLFSVNYSYTKSEVNAGPGTTVISPITFLPTPSSQFGLDGSVLQGTPENIVNAQFGYETPVSQLTLIVGWLDDRLLRRGLGSVLPVYDHPGYNIDLVYKREIQIGDRPVTLGLSGRNLTGEVHEEYRTFGTDRTFADRYPRGQTLSVSLSTDF